MAADSVTEFFRLFGDADGDRISDDSDDFLFRSAAGEKQGESLSSRGPPSRPRRSPAPSVLNNQDDMNQGPHPMRNLTRILLPAVAAACLLAPPIAEAGSAYQFAFDQSMYLAAPGGQVLVSVYLQERVSDGTASVLATEGLIGAGVRVAFDLAPLPSDPARIGKLGDISLNDRPGAFSGGFQGVGLAPGSYAQLTETVDHSSPAVTAMDLGGGLYQIPFGTFCFTAGSIAGQITLIEALDIPGSSDTIAGGGTTLNSLIAPGRAGIRVELGTSAVPEPSGLLGLAIGMVCAGGYGLARRRRQPTVSDIRTIAAGPMSRPPAGTR